MKFGVHTSIAGGLENAVSHAKRIGCDTFQMFSANPRGWRFAGPKPEAIERFRAARAKSRLSPVVVHSNYLINLASSDARIRSASIEAFRRELERARALGADFLVTHPGSARDGGRQEAIERCASALREAAHGLKLDRLTILIENTAGQGSVIGRTFEEVAAIIAAVRHHLPAGACIDTAHCFEAGYPLDTAEGLRETLKHLDRTIGLANVRVIHANDSKTRFASHSDRHEHIGRGFIGKEAFGRILRHPKLARIPFICETPIDRPGDDKRNLTMMRKLAGKS